MVNAELGEAVHKDGWRTLADKIVPEIHKDFGRYQKARGNKATLYQTNDFEGFVEVILLFLFILLAPFPFLG